MTDSGVDTSNESNISNENATLDASACLNMFGPPTFVFNQAGQAMQLDCFQGKMKHTNEARHWRVKCRYSGILNASKNQKLQFAASTNNTELVERLLLCGADPNSSDEHKRSPLHFAASRGYIAVVKILIKHGADPNIKDALGNTPLHLAVCSSHIPVVTHLLDAGTDVSLLDKHGHSPIQLAISKIKFITKFPFTPENKSANEHMLNEVRCVAEMMLKYMAAKKADTNEIEQVCQRLEHINTKEEVDTEVQNILDSLDVLKL